MSKTVLVYSEHTDVISGPKARLQQDRIIFCKIHNLMQLHAEKCAHIKTLGKQQPTFKAHPVCTFSQTNNKLLKSYKFSYIQCVIFTVISHWLVDISLWPKRKIPLLQLRSSQCHGIDVELCIEAFVQSSGVSAVCLNICGHEEVTRRAAAPK